MAKILVADDDTLSLDALALTLSGDGHEVLRAANGQEAYDLVQKHQPDLVFLDTAMPIFDGYETCALIRKDPEIPATLPIVFLTSIDSDARIIDKVGGTARLPKNHGAVELRDLVVNLLGPLAVP